MSVKEKLLLRLGDEIFSGERKIGRITSSTLSPSLNKPISIGYIRREFRDSGTNVVIHGADNSQLKAQVAELPFYRGSFKSHKSAPSD